MKFARYIVVGLVAFAIDYGVLVLLAERIHLVLANSIAFLVANAANFLMAHGWVFGRSLDRRAAPQYAGVVVVSLVGLALNDALVWTAVEVAGLALLPAKAIATGVTLFWNFAARTAWIYREGNAT